MTQLTKKRTISLRRILLMPKGTDVAMHLSILWLGVFGTLMIMSASMGIAITNQSYLVITLIKQIVFLFGGYFAMIFLAWNFNFDFFHSRKFAISIIITGLAIMSTVFFSAAGGARAWIRLPFFGVTIQPAEFAKIMMILIVAGYCGDNYVQKKSAKEILKRPLLTIGLFLGYVLLIQKDLGSMAVMFLIAVICFELAGNPKFRKLQRIFMWLFAIGFVFSILILSPFGESIIKHLPLAKYQINRFLSATNPFVDIYGAGYQIVKGLISFASGGIKGVGFGTSVVKYTDFPAANTDFILAIVVEELGYGGFLLIFIPYLIIVFQLFRYASRMQFEQSKMILIGTAMYIVIHSLFNVGGVTGMIPLTGVPLLMISSGGSSTLSIMCAIGLSQAVIYRYHRGEMV